MDFHNSSYLPRHSVAPQSLCFSSSEGGNGILLVCGVFFHMSQYDCTISVNRTLTPTIQRKILDLIWENRKSYNLSWKSLESSDTCRWVKTHCDHFRWLQQVFAGQIIFCLERVTRRNEWPHVALWRFIEFIFLPSACDCTVLVHSHHSQSVVFVGSCFQWRKRSKNRLDTICSSPNSRQPELATCWGTQWSISQLKIQLFPQELVDTKTELK